MGAHYTFLGQIIHGPGEGADWEKFVTAILLSSALVYLGKKASAPVKAQGPEALIVPSEKIGLTGFFDFFVEKFVAFQDSILGKENREFLPLTGSVFLFIFAANLLGLVPGVAAVTTTVWVNVGVALVVFTAFNYYGVRANGVGGYFKHLLGPIWWLAPAFFCVELISILLRILTLNLRLYWNISADHILLGIMTDLTKVGVPVVFYAMGTFVAFMQAFVFTILTMIYILLAVQHEEEHH
jgi:F-type H+-transporting ATPase subunit a